MPEPQKQRLLIFVIAYYAEETLTWVLERIPQEVFDLYACEILIVDDASQDRTFDIGRHYKKQHPDTPVTVLRNAYTQGYGGNQKVGYTYAIAQGFDFVAMIHGDGQYAPEELPRLVRPLSRGEADAVFGSRMMTGAGALRGGMPFYKFVGNKVLTRAQNLLLGSKLSEFHSGYRIYTTAALRKIHYKLNSNDFHFDTEVIVQLLNAGLKILELPIPTYYGDEICRVNGLKYAGNVMLAVLRNAFHRSGLLYQRRLDPVETTNEHYDLKLNYPSSHQFALDEVGTQQQVIDIGAGPCGMAQELAKRGCKVTVVDQYPPRVKPLGIEVVVQDINQPPTFDVRDHNIILLLDVIEHLANPEKFLQNIRQQFDYTPKTLLLSTPNIAFVVQRLMLLCGQFNYGKAGILDQTHTRLFTFRSIKHLLRDAGFTIKSVRGVPAPFPKVFGNGRLGRSLLSLNMAGIRLSKTLFSYQIFIVAESTPDLNFILADTTLRSERATA